MKEWKFIKIHIIIFFLYIYYFIRSIIRKFSLQEECITIPCENNVRKIVVTFTTDLLVQKISWKRTSRLPRLLP